MADEKQKYPARLYDANGQHVADIETDDDISLAEHRERVVEAGGKTYIYNARNNQWREAGETVKVSAKAVDKVESEDPKPQVGGPTVHKS